MFHEVSSTSTECLYKNYLSFILLDGATCLDRRRLLLAHGRCVFAYLPGESFLSVASSARRSSPAVPHTWQREREGEKDRKSGRKMGVSRAGPQGFGPIWRRSSGIVGGSRLE